MYDDTSDVETVAFLLWLLCVPAYLYITMVLFTLFMGFVAWLFSGAMPLRYITELCLVSDNPFWIGRWWVIFAVGILGAISATILQGNSISSPKANRLTSQYNNHCNYCNTQKVLSMQSCSNCGGRYEVGTS